MSSEKLGKDKAKAKADEVIKAITMNTVAMPTITQRFWRMEPKTPPVRETTTNMVVKSTTMPPTNAVDRAMACPRVLACFAPKTLTVIAIIG